jgi:hypothetical protein
LRRGLGSFLVTAGSLGSPGDDAVGAHQYGAQAKAILGVTGNIRDPIAPAAGKRLKRSAGVKVQKKAASFAEERTEFCAIDKLEVGSAAAYKGVAAA